MKTKTIKCGARTCAAASATGVVVLVLRANWPFRRGIMHEHDTARGNPNRGEWIGGQNRPSLFPPEIRSQKRAVPGT
jgi:hypothetical protein